MTQNEPSVPTADMSSGTRLPILRRPAINPGARRSLMVTTPAVVVTARLLDRVGQGIRGAPRDALVADVAPPEIRGACFGLRTIGAFLGPLLAIALMLWFADHIRIVLWFAVVPAFIAISLIVVGYPRTRAYNTSATFPEPAALALLAGISGALLVCRRNRCDV